MKEVQLGSNDSFIALQEMQVLLHEERKENEKLHLALERKNKKQERQERRQERDRQNSIDKGRKDRQQEQQWLALGCPAGNITICTNLY